MSENSAQSAPIEHYLDALKAVYQEGGEIANWEQESRIYPYALRELIKDLKDSYDLECPLKLGSTATVWKLTDRRLGQQRALKLPRPHWSRLSSIVRVIRGEQKKLAALNHQNIIKIYTAGELKFVVDKDGKGHQKNDQPNPNAPANDEYSFPYFVMEFLPGVRDFADFIEESALTCSALELVEYFRNVLSGLEYLHQQGIVHCDLKPGNILIAAGRPALITDFGYAKHFPRPGNPAQKTDVTFTRHYGHPDLLAHINDSTDKNATIAVIPKEKLKKQFDLYALGKTFLEILRKHIDKREQANTAAESFSPYQRQFVSIVAKRLLDGFVDHVTDDDLDSDIIPGLAKPVMEEIKYRTPNEALADLEKLLDLYSIEGDVPELNPNISDYIQIPHCQVPRTSRVEDVINHPAFTRLAQVTQLGFVSLVYPGAYHTRYEHVLGTFAHCCAYVRALWNDQRNPLFQCLMTRHDIELLLSAALLHDVGQYPMAHDLSEVSSEFSHEPLGARMLEMCNRPGSESLADVVLTKWGVDIDELVGIWAAKADSPFKYRLLKSIISGPLDCDKIDYIRRDSTHIGVTFGLAFDHERLLRNVTIAHAPRIEGGKVTADKMDIVGLAVSEKALVVAEDLVEIRRKLFSQVYWHHTIRSLKAMLGFAVRNTLLWFDDPEHRNERSDLKDEFWAEFHSEIFWRSGRSISDAITSESVNQSGTAVGDLTVEEWLGDRDDGPEMNLTSGLLSHGDDAVLILIRRFAPPREQQIIDRIRGRQLFKRLYVLTSSREKERFEQIYNRFHEYRLAGNLWEIEQLRQTCERHIRDRVLETIDKKTRDCSTPELVDVRARIADTNPLVLLDVPVKALSRASDRESIWYLPEDIFGSKSNNSLKRTFFSRPAPLEEEPFDKAVGKIRLFVPHELKVHLLNYLADDPHETITDFLTQ